MSTSACLPPPVSGPASTRPGRVLADNASFSKAIRAHLRRRKIKATIPEPADQIRNRQRRGSRGRRPPAFDCEIYKQRVVGIQGPSPLKRRWRVWNLLMPLWAAVDR